MNQRSPARKALTILGALAIAGVTLFLATGVVVMSGTKATFSFVSVKAPPGGVTTTTNTTTAAKTATTATSSDSPAQP